jgi:hypothetical protein
MPDPTTPQGALATRLLEDGRRWHPVTTSPPAMPPA